MKRVDYWIERDAWPFVKPGYLFLPAAFDWIGKEMFGSAWTGEESRLKPKGPRPSAPGEVFETYEVKGSPNLFRRIKDASRYNQEEHRIAGILGLTEMQRLAGISFDQWGKAIDAWLKADLAEPGIRERIRAVYGQMHLAAAADELRFYIADVRNGRMMPIREGDWNFDREVVYPRFDRCSMNLDPEFIRSKPPRDTRSEQRYLSHFLHPLFVEKTQLETIAPVIGRRHRGEPEPIALAQQPAPTLSATTAPPVSTLSATEAVSSDPAGSKAAPREVPRTEVRAWIADHVLECGERSSANRLDKEKKAKFEGRISPSRDLIREIFAEEREKADISAPRRGASKKSF